MIAKTIIRQNSVYIYLSKNRQPLRIPLHIKASKLLDNGLLGKNSGIDDLDIVNDFIKSELKRVQKAYDDFPKLTVPELKAYILKGQLPVTEKSDPVPEVKPLTFLEAFQVFIEDSETGVRLTKKKQRLGKSTIKGYKSTLANLKKFGETYDLSSWENINDKFYDSFCEWSWYKKNHFDNHVGKAVKILKTAVTYLSDKKLIPVQIDTKRWHNWREDIEILVLYKDEIKILANMDLPSEKLQRTRDIFIFGLSTCLRINDLLSLTRNDLLLIKGNLYLNMLVGKTQQHIKIRLNSYAVQVVEKYKDQFHTILPKISDTKFNENLKELAACFADYLEQKKETENLQIIGNDWQSDFKRKRSKKGKFTYEYLKPSDYISSHCMRRTGITTLLIQGMNPYEVSAISGHSLNSKDFVKYVRIAEDIVENKSIDAWNEVFN